jgi:excisionase family DNA binding protein
MNRSSRVKYRVTGTFAARIPFFIPLFRKAIMRNAAARSNLLVPEVREVMDIRQASNYLGISADTLYKYASDGFVPAFKLGNRWRFKRSRLDEWMDRQSDLQAGGEVDASKKKPVQREAV